MSPSRVGWFCAVGSAACVALLAGCGGAMVVRENFAGDFNCEGEIFVTDISQERYRASGCGTSAVYQCIGNAVGWVCSLQISDRADSSEGATRATGPTSGPVMRASSKVGAQGEAIRAELTLDDKTLVKLYATPNGKSKKVLLHLIQRLPARAYYEAVDTGEAVKEKECEIGWLVNGQRMKGPEAKVARDRLILTYQARLPAPFVRELALAEKLSLRLCDDRWSLSPEQMQHVRRFFELYEEEIAWQGDAAKGPTGGLAAPSGGWPGWAAPDASAMKPADTGKVLDATALFKHLSRSVYQIEARLLDGRSQGSAVAVTQTEVLTNCHVVAGARKIVLKREKREWLATLGRSDPATDRCVLSVPEPILEPISGVRTWSSLEVGEPLYAIGAPAGLELSLSNGILSGVREKDGSQFVQTTAPISPGSSGGGLFDVRGNLVGVTTAVVLGREKLNQSLNLAIPAERFFAK